MNIPAPDTLFNSLSRGFRKIQNNRILKNVADLLLGKYLFLTGLLVSLFISFDVIEKISTTDVLLYYTLPCESNQFHINNLGGIFGYAIGNITSLGTVFKFFYIALVVWGAILITWWCGRIPDKLKRAEFLGVTAVFLKAFMLTGIYESSLLDVYDLQFNLFLSLLLLGTAATLAHSAKLGWIPAVVILSAAAQLVDSRTFIILIPFLVFLCITAGGIAHQNANRLRIICAFSGITVIAVFAVTQLMSLNNDVDWQPIAEYILTHGESGLDLEYVNIENFYRQSVWDNLPIIIVEYSDPTIFPVKSNAVLVMLSLGCAYFIGYIKRRKSGSEKRGVFAALKSAVTFNEDNRNAKFPVAFLVLFLFYTDILAPRIGLIEFTLILAVAVLAYVVQKPKFCSEPAIERRYFFGSVIVLVLLKLLICILAMESEPFAQMHYYVSYQSFGLIPRGLIGSIFYALFGEIIPFDNMLIVLKIAFAVLLGLFVLFLWWMNRSSDERSANTVIKPLTMVFLISPVFSLFFHSNNIFKLDYFFICITLLCLFLAVKNKPFVWAIPLLCVVCMLIHTVFACTMFPILFIVLVYRAFIYSEGHAARNTSVMLLSLGAVAALFLYFTFVYTVPDELTLEGILDTMAYRSVDGLEPDSVFVKLIWADKDNEHIGYFQSLIKPSQIVNFAYVFICALPLTLMYLYALNHSAKAEKKALPKLGYLAMGLAPFVTFVPAVTETDYGRWCSYYLLTIMLGIALLSKMQPENAKWFDGIDTGFLKRFFGVAFIPAACFPTFDAFIRIIPFFGR